MEAVWTQGEVTVREVHARLRQIRPIAYTTVMTMMRILEEKGHLTKSSSERAHVYVPASPRHQVVGAMLKDFVDRVFDGASESLFVHLAKDNRLTPKQRLAIDRLVKDLED